jgi:hypothetical protein
VLGWVFVLLLLQPAAGQGAGTGAPRSAVLDWNGRPITRTCNADPRHPEGFKAALSAHEHARAGFLYKMRLGLYRVPREFYDRYRAMPERELIGAIAARLQTQSSEKATAALIYDTGIAEGRYAVCVWLLTGNGIEAAATVPLPPWPLSGLVQAGLDVTRRASARAPQRRAGRAAKKRAPVPEAALPPESLAGWVSRPEEALRQAADVLLPGPVADRLRTMRLDRLLILPASDIGTVPFAALPLAGKMLIDHAPLAVLADIDGLSFAVWFERQQRHETIVIGDPDLKGDKDWVFAPLPSAREEAQFAARMLGVAPLIGINASSASVLSVLRRRSATLGLIYMATHGIADPVNPMDGSFLALSGRHLYAREIRGLELLSQPLVVMSACQTGLGKVFPGGVFGLARAWYYAGAAQVITSLWNIDDDATKLLMSEFVRALPAMSAERALRQAMLATRASHADPALWAGFAVYGYPTNHNPARRH